MDFSLIAENFKNSFVGLHNPASRLFYFHLAASAVICLAWQANFKESLKKLLNKNYWWNQSTRTDYFLHIINSVVKAICIYFFYSLDPKLLSHLTQITMGFLSLQSPLELSVTAVVIFSIFTFVIDDFTRFGFHAITHISPWLWQLHKVHHSATTLTPFTLYRVHPIEVGISLLRQLIVNSIFVGLFVALFGTSYAVYTLFGISALHFAADFLGGTLRHSHIPISFGKFEYFFMSPKQHQIHHSMHPDHINKNYGDALAVWDLIFKTHFASRAAPSPLKFGLAEQKSVSL